MIIRGRFIGNAPYFAARLRSTAFRGLVWFLADTGASRTTLLDRDARILGLAATAGLPASRITGIGGSVQGYRLQDVEITFASDQGDYLFQQDLWVVQHDLGRLSRAEAARLLRLPSVLGRDVIQQFRFTCDYPAGSVELVRP